MGWSGAEYRRSVTMSRSRRLSWDCKRSINYVTVDRWQEPTRLQVLYIAQYVYILYSCRYIDNTVYRNNGYIIANNKYKANSIIAGKCQIKKNNYIQVTWLRNIFSSQNTVRIVKSRVRTQETPKRTN